jgi:hypothetical protein
MTTFSGTRTSHDINNVIMNWVQTKLQKLSYVCAKNNNNNNNNETKKKSRRGMEGKGREGRKEGRKEPMDDAECFFGICVL